MNFSISHLPSFSRRYYTRNKRIMQYGGNDFLYTERCNSRLNILKQENLQKQELIYKYTKNWQQIL